MKCGLLGRKLGHSYSPQIHENLGEYAYTLFEKEPEQLPLFLKSGDFSGINVTIPYKKAVIPYLDSVTDVAGKLGAVNTVVRQQNGKLLGHNSDYFGFRSLLDHGKISVSGKKVLVLGSGGASATAVQVLRDLGAEVVVISRSGPENYSNVYLHEDAAIIVNTTPVGMYPNNGQSPLDLNLFSRVENVVDVIYNPARTQLLLDAEQKGIPGSNGLWMLVAQAKESAEFFTGAPIADQKIAQIYKKLRNSMENIILIGMPGCGKSTIAAELGRILERPVLDADAEIERIAGKPIPQIFTEEGEQGFRQYETQVLDTLGKKSGLIIATGGGCVTQNRNYPLLHQNGRIFWITRNLDHLPKDGRPLSMTQDLHKMYDVRKPMYEAFADYRISNDGTAAETVRQILAVLEENV